jgi:hypothetical protein
MTNELLQTAKVTVPQQHSGLQVFGLQWPATPNLVYSTLDEAMSAGTLDVTEVSAEGKVPELKVESRNPRTRPVLDSRRKVLSSPALPTSSRAQGVVELAVVPEKE